MYWPFLLCSCVICCCIAYQDLRYRAVSWLLFPGLALSGLMLSVSVSGSFYSTVKKAAINLLFIFFQLLLLQTWYYFRKGDRLVIGKKIGMGDILFLASVCVFFSFANFILFYISSLLFSLAAYLFFFRRSDPGEPGQTIPLAGLQSLFIIIFISVSKALSYNIITDEYLFTKLTQ